MTRTSSKESTARLFQRYVWLVDTIYSAGGKITFEEINNKWTNSGLNGLGEDLPLKTFHNHKTAIRDMFDIDIECNKRNGYTYYIDNSEDLERGGVRTWLLNTFAVNNLINESHKLKHRILFEKIPSGQQLLPSIISAMRDGVAIEVEYQSYQQDNPHTFNIEPYCLKIFRQRWYVVGNSAKEEIRCYSLDRIKGLNLTDKKFILPTNFNAEEHFINSFGISNVGKGEKVEIKVFHGTKKEKYFESLPLHHSQQTVTENDEYTIFSYYIQPTYDFRQELLSHGAEIEVLSPKWFREEIANIIRRQNSIYV